MAGGRRGGAGRGRGRSNNNGSKNKSCNGSGGGRRRGSAIRGALFVDGGFLSDWSFAPTPSRGKNPSVNNKSGSYDRTNSASSGPKSGSWISGGNNIGYRYPSFDLQDGVQPESRFGRNNEDNNLDDSHTFALVDSKETQIFAYVDQKPFSKFSDVAFSYDYSSGFALGDSSHRGLGFSDELEESQSGVETSLMQTEEKEDPFFNSFSSEQDMDTEERNNDEIGVVTAEESPALILSPKKNSGFLSIGGSSESDDSEDTSDSDSDVDEEVVEDYLEGIGGRENILNAKWLVEQELNGSDDDTSSSSGYDNTVKKLGGIALQEASRDYGMKKAHSGQKYNRTARDSWSSAIDDFMLIKDPRTVPAKKKHVAHYPQSWPLGAQKSKSSRTFPGAKKKHRKEAIAVKRRDRMLRRGVDLEQINLKLEQIVLDGVDMYSFQPMHFRDCSQVRRLASIYRLQSGCQGSGKKRFVTVTRTHHTCMPSSNDRDRLEKLMGAGMEDADFSVVERSNIKSVSGDGKRSKKIGKGNTLIRSLELGQSAERKASAKRHGRTNEYRQNGKKDSYASQPVSFVSSGVMRSETETVEITPVDSMEMDSSSENKVVAGSATFGAFEVHTKGFGSKMMAKMGFVEGGGLGKDGQGVAKPIEVVKRPKSLGLGVEFSNTIDDPATSDPTRSSKPLKNKTQSHADPATSDPTSGKPLKNKSHRHATSDPATSDPGSSKQPKNKSQRLGAFEKHTKGFGSKMMAKMGFVEGLGLGKDSQGIVNPLVAVRLPKSRGLGAQG
ncbi:R3H domain containing protein [Parasponia andersonii]|uniref:R3H domain containing protein n=1 Tax=Parasponia andersonii TaxID=3476 RepID=A0A2P5D1F2_PARAD|nr:R3H domain containing protein [Parasponia andersonii]